ncbi:mobile mystery protein A [bacterium]|nr:mobile mystery protein A [bacterium]
MKKKNQNLRIAHLDNKFTKMRVLKTIEVPLDGWINAIRTTLNMSLTQLARRLKKNPVSVREMEERERDKSITLKKLIEIGEALDLQFVYGFYPKESSLKKMIEKRAREVAYEIVTRTSHSMKLEDQENTERRLRKALQEKAQELEREVPKHLWD